MIRIGSDTDIGMNSYPILSPGMYIVRTNRSYFEWGQLVNYFSSYSRIFIDLPWCKDTKQLTMHFLIFIEYLHSTFSRHNTTMGNRAFRLFISGWEKIQSLLIELDVRQSSCNKHAFDVFSQGLYVKVAHPRFMR